MARFGSSARTGLIWFAGLLAAGFSGMAAFASVSSTRIPLAAVDTVPENGRAYAEADAEILGQRRGRYHDRGRRQQGKQGFPDHGDLHCVCPFVSGTVPDDGRINAFRR